MCNKCARGGFMSIREGWGEDKYLFAEKTQDVYLYNDKNIEYRTVDGSLPPRGWTWNARGVEQNNIIHLRIFYICNKFLSKIVIPEMTELCTWITTISYYIDDILLCWCVRSDKKSNYNIKKKNFSFYNNNKL